jgi:hypothetical protein
MGYLDQIIEVCMKIIDVIMWASILMLIGSGLAAKNGPIEMRNGANITLDDGWINGASFPNGTAAQDAVTYSQVINYANRGMVIVGDGTQYDIDVDPTSTTEGHVITDAVTLLMARTANVGGKIFIAPCTINNSASAASLTITIPAGSTLIIEGSGSAATTIIGAAGYDVLLTGTGAGNSVTTRQFKNFKLRGPSAGSLARSGLNLSGFCGKVENVQVANCVLGFDLSRKPPYSFSMYDCIADYCVYGYNVSGYFNMLYNCRAPYLAPTQAGYTNIKVGYCLVVQPGDVVAPKWNHLIDCDGGNALIGVDINTGIGNIVQNFYVEPHNWYNVVNIKGGSGNMVYSISGITHTIATPEFINITNSNGNIIDIPTSNGVHDFRVNVDADSDNNVITRLGAYSIYVTDNGVGTIYTRVITGTSATPPRTVYHYKGDVMWNLNAAGSGVPGWVCTTAGSPGTWKAMAALAA